MYKLKVDLNKTKPTMQCSIIIDASHNSLSHNICICFGSPARWLQGETQGHGIATTRYLPNIPI